MNTLQNYDDAETLNKSNNIKDKQEESFNSLSGSEGSFTFDALMGGKKTNALDKNFVINPDKDEHSICCCRKEEPHDETMKFKLIGT